MSKTTKLTKEGMLKLESELEFLVTEKRQEIAQKIKEARSFGDLSENSEYDEAMNDQARVEAKIADIENLLRNVEVVEETDQNSINLGSKVVLKMKGAKKDLTILIVGSAEANPRENPMRISDESEVGQKLIGKNVGDSIETESGVTYKIESIN